MDMKAQTIARFLVLPSAVALLLVVLNNKQNFGPTFHVARAPELKGTLDSACYGNLTYMFHLRNEARQGEFQRIGENGSGSYVYSAYIDDRPAPDVDAQTLPVVRLLTWLRRDEQQHVVRRWRCLLWFDQLSSPMDVPVLSWTHLNVYNTGSRIVPAIVICHSPTVQYSNFGAISLVTSRCHLPTNIVELVDLRRRDVHMGNEDARSSQAWQYSVNFTVCVHSPLFGTVYSASDFLEFVEVNRVFGVERVVLYVEPPVDKKLLTCFERYKRLGLVDLRHWSQPSDIANAVHYHGQILAMNDCLYRTMYVTKYLALHDLDEFIVPLKTTNWNDMISSINSRIPDPEGIASYNIRHRFFPLDLPDLVDLLLISNVSTSPAATAVMRRYRLRTLRKATAHAQLWRHTVRSKLITRPEYLTAVYVHEARADNLVLQRRRFRPNTTKFAAQNVMVGEDDAQLFHYRRTQTTGVTLVNITRMRVFTPMILQRFLTLNATSIVNGSGQ